MSDVYVYTETRTTESSSLIKLLEDYGKRIKSLEQKVKKLEQEKNPTNVKLS